MSDDGITRVQYFEGQFLRTQDFTTEQSYHVAMRRRHNIAHHIWGIVAGLELSVDADQGIWVSPGMAVDGYGRELVLPERRGLSPAAFDERDSDTLGVWLLYDRLSSDQAPPGYAGCRTNGAGPDYRWQEYPLLRMDRVDSGQPDMRRPLSVPEGDLAFDPTRTAPDDPGADWPVFLGLIRRQRSDPALPATYTVVKNEYGRPYAGLVGARIDAPSGLARLQLGASSPADRRRFAVFVHDQPQPATQLPTVPPLEMDQCGATTLRGKTSIHADLTVDGGAIMFTAGSPQPEPDSPPSAPVKARPWQVYHHIEKIEEPAAQAPAARSAAHHFVHELRIEMGQSGRGANRVVIGAWSPDDQAFKPCLTVADNCQVTVHGNLVVKGTLTEQQTRPAPQITPAYKALVLAQMSGAISTVVDEYRKELFRAPEPPSRPESDPKRRAGEIALELQDNEALRNAFIERLRTEPSNLATELKNLGSEPQ